MPETPKQEPTFASVLDDLMASRGLNQAALARGLGVWDANVGRWRRGGGIEIDNVRKIADFFGVDRDYLERLAGYGDKQVANAGLAIRGNERRAPTRFGKPLSEAHVSTIQSEGKV